MIEFGLTVLTYKLNLYGKNHKNSYTVESTKDLKQIDLKEGRELIHKAIGIDTTSYQIKNLELVGLLIKVIIYITVRSMKIVTHEYYLYLDPKKADKIIVKEEFF